MKTELAFDAGASPPPLIRVATDRKQRLQQRQQREASLRRYQKRSSWMSTYNWKPVKEKKYVGDSNQNIINNRYVKGRNNRTLINKNNKRGTNNNNRQGGNRPGRAAGRRSKRPSTTSSSNNLNVPSYGSSPACGTTCNNTLSASASGYDSGSGNLSESGYTPLLIPSCTIQSGFNWNYNFSHNPSRPTSSPDGCSTIKLQTNGISNLTGLGVRASDCAGSWPSSWTDTVGATFSYIRCTGATGTTTGNIPCTGGGNATGLIWPANASGALYNA